MEVREAALRSLWILADEALSSGWPSPFALEGSEYSENPEGPTRLLSGSGTFVPIILAMLVLRGAFSPEKISTKEASLVPKSCFMAFAYSSQKPFGYSLSRLVAKEVTLPFTTLGFQVRCGRSVLAHLELEGQIFPMKSTRGGILCMRT